MKRFAQTGFTFIELMIGVAVIAILAALAIPQYQILKERAYQAEAEVLLDDVVKRELVFKAGNDLNRYGNFDEIGFSQASFSAGNNTSNSVNLQSQIMDVAQQTTGMQNIQVVDLGYTRIYLVDWTQGPGQSATDLDEIIVLAHKQSGLNGDSVINFVWLQADASYSYASFNFSQWP